MADKEVSGLPPATAEDLRIAAGHFEYAHRVTSAGSYDIAIGMLRTCCRLVPANLAYRQALRKVEKTKYKGNLRGSLLAPLVSWRGRLRMWKARRRADHRMVLDHGEAVLARNPWDREAILCMAEAAGALRLTVVAAWLLQEGREKNPNDVRINRALAKLLEEEGRFAQAMSLWELVRKVLPTDREAAEKAKQLAVSDTIARGNYEESVATDVTTPFASKGSRATPADSTRANPVASRSAQEAEVLRVRIAADPSVPDSYLQLAALEKRQGRYSEARAILEDGAAKTNDAPAVGMALSELEVEILRRGVGQTERQLLAAPQDEKLLKTLRKLHHKIETLELASFRLKVERDPGDKALRLELGKRLLDAGQIDEAIAELQVARGEQRLYWKAVLYLGHCFAKREKWPLAQRNFEEALKNLPDGEKEHRKEVMFLLAEGYAEAGELPRAIELALDLADMDYSYRNIGQLLEEYQRRLQEPRGTHSR